MESNIILYNGNEKDNYTINTNSKIIDFKKKISEKIGIPAEEQDIFYFPNFLTDDETFESLKMEKNGYFIFLLFKKDETYDIKITHEDHYYSDLILTINDSMSIKLIRNIIKYKDNHNHHNDNPKIKYDLLSDSIILNEDKMAKDYNLKEKASILVAIHRLKG